MLLDLWLIWRESCVAFALGSHTMGDKKIKKSFLPSLYFLCMCVCFFFCILMHSFVCAG